MRISAIADRKLVITDLRAEIPAEAVREILEAVRLVRGFSPMQVQSYLKEILDRCKRTACGLGRGVAFPNARIKDLGRPNLAVAMSEKGVDFGAEDGRRAHAILLYLGNAQPNADELSMLRRLSAGLADEHIVERLMRASSESDVMNTLDLMDARWEERHQPGNQQSPQDSADHVHLE